MFWLRVLTLLAPVGVVAAAVWLTSQARRLDYRTDSDLIVAVRQPPTEFNPLAMGIGTNREVSELLFDRLLRLDDDLQFQAHAAARWGYRHRATLFFTSGEAAHAASQVLEKNRGQWPQWSLSESVTDGDLLHLTSTSPQLDWLPPLTKRLDPDGLSPLLHVRLRVREAVQRSFENFLSGSVEKGQIRHTRYSDDRTADLFVQGETDLFLKELRLYYDSNLNLDPDIATLETVSWITDLDFEIELRPDMRWHDDEAVTADDLLFTFNEITRPGSPWPLRNAYHFVERMEKAGDFTVRARCRTYYAPALERWGKLPLLPSHRLGLGATPEEWDAFLQRPVGSGPYRLESLGPDGSVVLGANATYFRGTPRQATIRYQNAPDPGARLLALKLGSFDVFEPDDSERRWAAATGGATLVEDVPRYQSFVAWNLDRPALADPRVREALARLVDPSEFLPGVAGGQAKPWRTLFFPGSWFCNTSAELPPPDPAAAEALFAEAGWRRADRESPLKNASGESFAIQLGYDAEDRLHQELATALLPLFREAGIQIRLEPLDWATLVETRLNPRDFDALLLGWELDFSRDQWAVWHSSEAGAGGSNFSGLKDPEIDRLLATLRTEDRPDQVKAAASRLQERLVSLQPCLFLCATRRALALRSGAVRVSLPAEDGQTWTNQDPVIGPSGLFASRPWWVRTPPNPVESATQQGQVSSPASPSDP